MDEELCIHRHRALILLALLYIRKRKNKNDVNKRLRKYWMHPSNVLKRQQRDWFNLVHEMRLQNDETFFNYTRMTPNIFDNLLSKVGPVIQKIETNWKTPIPAAARLAMTLRYLATGDRLHTIALSYRTGTSTTSQIIRETCEAIWDCLYKEILFTPSYNGWQEVAYEFQEKWNFPNCIGALEGKHVTILCPQKTGSTYYNYKDFHSVVLIALVSGSYKFLLVDIGAQDRHSDGGIFFKNSIMGQRFYNNMMYLPDPSIISVRHKIPYVIVADEAFQLTSFTMRPYPSKNLSKEQKIFNYRLSRTRRVVENAFGILTSRWRIYYKPLNTSLQTVDAIIKATICLHNLLMDTTQYCGENYADKISTNGQIIEGEWRRSENNCNLKKLINCGSNNYTQYAGEVRNTFMDYFMYEGQVPWQEETI